MASNVPLETVTFVQTAGLPASEWDAKKRKTKFSFQRRVFTTCDPEIIRLLDARGYTRQATVDHWTIAAKKALEASGCNKSEVTRVFRALQGAGLKAEVSTDPVLTAVTKNVRGPATTAPVTARAENQPPGDLAGLDAPEGLSGLDRMDMTGE